MEQKFYTASHKLDDIIKKSSSGGAFTAVTDAWVEAYGDRAVIYGCILDESLKAKHIRATDSKSRDKMRGSKYIESDISGINAQVEEDLKNGLYAVFSGTPCQISGLKTYLKNKGIETEENLLTVEVLCHGVAEDKFFADYISNLEKKYKSKAVNCSFRSKGRPDALERMQVLFENGKKYTASSTKYDWFYSAYLGNFVLKPACYECKFAKPERYADITIGDNWGGYEKSGEKAGSVIITNSTKAESWVKRAFENMNFSEIPFDLIHKDQLSCPASKPASYDEFWNIYKKGGYLAAQKFIGNNTLKGKCRCFMAFVLDKLHLIGFAKKIKRILK